MDEFKVGDTVELASGGPVMTVTKVQSVSYDDDRRPRVNCQWYEDHQFRTRAFVPSALRKTNRRSAPHPSGEKVRPSTGRLI